MGKKSNIIEINGKRYDARSGALLSSHAIATHVPAHHTVKPIAQPATHVAVKEEKPKVVQEVAAIKPLPTKIKVHEAVKAPKHPASKAPQTSKTLMRSAVKKPQRSLKRHNKAQSSTDALMDHPAARLQHKASVHHLDSARLETARKTPKSQAVKKFGKLTGPPAAPPTDLPRPHHKPHQTPPHERLTTTSHPAVQNVHHSAAADLFEKAMQNATSHEQAHWDLPKRRHTSAKLASVGLLAISFVVLGGFMTYQNIAGAKLKIASSKAGFAVSLPSYKPAGYRLSHMSSSPGVVSLDYQNGGSQGYAVTEKVSQWNDDALRSSFLASSGQQYQTVESNGQTFFLYGQNAATWVDGGVWYQVQGDGALSDEQLVQLAASI